MTQNDKVSVQFVGRKAPFFDDLYGSRLTFEAGQVRAVPTALAKQLLKHQDLFVLSDSPATENKKQKAVDVDDTDAVLEESQREQEEQHEQQMNIEDIRLRVMTTENKDELADMAMLHWQQPLKKSMSLDNMRASVIQFIDQFGIV